MTFEDWTHVPWHQRDHRTEPGETLRPGDCAILSDGETVYSVVVIDGREPYRGRIDDVEPVTMAPVNRGSMVEFTREHVMQAWE